MKFVIFSCVLAIFLSGCLDPFSPFAEAKANIAPVEICAVTLPRIENYNPFSGPTSDTRRTTITGPSNPDPASGK